MKTRFPYFCCLLVLVVLPLSGCASNGLTRYSSSVPLGELIEPVKDSRQTERKTALTLPASVAILMAPGKHAGNMPNTTLRQAAEALKEQLLANPKFVSSVSIVTTDDMKGRYSLERIRDGYGADIAVILSHHQDQRASQNGAAGLADATIVGMFLVPGVEITTTSVIDGMVVHIPNNAVIFRASGLNERSTHSTTYSRASNDTEESIKGILAATADFGNSLCKSLTKFEKYDLSRAVPLSVHASGTVSDSGKERPANDYWESVNRYKSSGGGAFGLLPLLFSAAVACAAWRRK